jgi:hypothetical protein
MEDAALAQAGAERLQAPTADLPSLEPWRPEGCPPSATAAAPIASGQIAGRSAGEPGQPWEADCRGRWGESPDARPAPRPRGEPGATREGGTGPPGLDPQARHERATPARGSHPARPDRSSPGQASPGARVGSAVRAEQLRVPARTLRPRRDRGDRLGAVSQSEVRARRGHRQVLGAIVTLPPCCR